MGIHLKSLKIDAFKGIQNFNLDHLNHINILTGDNNSGKTTVLELLSTIQSPQDLRSWINSSRINTVAFEGIFFDLLYNLFPIDYELEHPVGYSYIDINDKTHEVLLSGEMEETQVTSSERNRMNGIRDNSGGSLQDDEDEILMDAQCLHFRIEGSDFEPEEYEIFDFQRRVSRFVNKKGVRGFKTLYVSPTAHAGRIRLNDVLSDAALFNDLIRLLQEFDENIINVVAVEKGSLSISHGTEYMVLSKNHKKALPLSNYGDGMKKALLMVSSMLKAKDGILLLDEFETAIHTSAMDQVFSWLIRCAIDLNVQVFLTSHSKEAINKVLRCDETLKDKISYYTLFNYEGKNLVRYLSCEDAIIMQDQGGVDIR